MNKLKFTCILSVCLATGCAPKLKPEFQTGNQPALNVPQQAGVTDKTKSKASTAISSWEISGAMAARSKEKGWSAALNWLQQGPNQYQIRLMGPLGGGTVLVEKSGSTVTYVDGPKRVSSSNADELLQRETGIRLPVHNLYYWVRGLPAPGAVQSSSNDNSGHLTSLTQSGYTIHYTNYTSVNNYDLPTRIQLQGKGVVIKLVVKHWRV